MMRRKNERISSDTDRVVKDIKRQTLRRFSAEEKIRIVMSGLRGEDSIAELCRKEGIAQSQYYSWSTILDDYSRYVIAWKPCYRCPAGVCWQTSRGDDEGQ
jgi:transposase-like protein